VKLVSLTRDVGLGIGVVLNERIFGGVAVSTAPDTREERLVVSNLLSMSMVDGSELAVNGEGANVTDFVKIVKTLWESDSSDEQAISDALSKVLE
jgi:hypothetical protein